MSLSLKKTNYKALNSKQKENYNFHKVASVLADYGFNSLRLNDDWQGADFIAIHHDGSLFVKVQLKGRFCFDKKYLGKDIFIAFPYKNYWYLYSHDDLLKDLEASDDATFLKGNNDNWNKKGFVTWSSPTKLFLKYLEKYRI